MEENIMEPREKDQEITEEAVLKTEDAIFETEEIKIEELSIDGICGVY